MNLAYTVLSSVMTNPMLIKVLGVIYNDSVCKLTKLKLPF